MNNYLYKQKNIKSIDFGSFQNIPLIYDYNENIIPTLFINTNKISMITCGKSHIIILMETGDVYSKGDNTYGQLGLGDNNDRNELFKIGNYNKCQIVCGSYHTHILTSNILYSFGNNTYGQLGVGDKNHRNIPCITIKSDNIKFVRTGGYHTFIYNKLGELYGIGSNNCGQLGTWNMEDKLEVTIIISKMLIKDITCGNSHTLILMKRTENINNEIINGEVEYNLCSSSCPTHPGYFSNIQYDLYVMGENNYGQLGLNDYYNRYVPTLLAHNIENISCGEYNSVIKEKNNVYTFGLNTGNININRNEKNTEYEILHEGGTIIKDNYGQRYKINQ